MYVSRGVSWRRNKLDHLPILHPTAQTFCEPPHGTEVRLESALPLFSRFYKTNVQRISMKEPVCAVDADCKKTRGNRICFFSSPPSNRLPRLFSWQEDDGSQDENAARDAEDEEDDDEEEDDSVRQTDIITATMTCACLLRSRRAFRLGC